ncbi:hypothetical protein J2X72_002687 [Phyllobacterium sp. 1468]|nr:hypothetical protein [Phyllobacterium sp. 1468]MDR6633887.1 hypothetical protein [Phyllobacterium sp. 1468]
MRTVQLLKKPGDEIGDLDIVIARGAVAEQRIGVTGRFHGPS